MTDAKNNWHSPQLRERERSHKTTTSGQLRERDREKREKAWVKMEAS